VANEELRFDIIGNDKASDAFSRVGRSAGDMGGKMDLAAKNAMLLDDALKRQQSAARASADATLSLAKSDGILAEVEGRLRDGALEAEFALKKEAEAKKKSGDAAVEAAAKNKTFADSLQKVADKAKKSGGPAWLGPALALAPVATSLAGAGAGAAAGLGGAAVAGGGALAAFGAVAKPVLAQALQAEQAMQKAQDAYSIAIANGTKKATAYKAEQVAIGKAYAEMSPQQIALSKQLGDMANAWQNVKAQETPVVAGALQPWLKSVTDLTGKLGPIIRDVSPVIRGLGTQFDQLVNSPAFTAFRNFIANTGSKAVGAVGGTLIDFVDAFITLLPKFNPLIEKAVGWIGDLGPAVLTWSQSKKASDDITKFMGWFSTNGPAVGNLLKNVGGALKALAPGLGPASVAELNVISGFFGWIAKLPPSVAKPLVETAGVLLTLNKLGVFSVGVKIVGAATGWVKKLLGGGEVDLGAAGMQKAGDTMAGAAAAMQKAADTMAGGIAVTAEGGKAAGVAGAAGASGLWSKILPGVRFAAGALIATVAIQAIGSTVPKVTGSGAAQVNADQKNTPGLAIKATDFFHVTNMAAWIDRDFSHPIRAWVENQLPAIFAAGGKDIEAAWNTTWNNTITRAAKGFHDLAGWFDTGRHDVAATTHQTGVDIGNWWNITWNNTVARTARGFHDVAGWFDTGRHNTAHYVDLLRGDLGNLWNTIWNNTVGRVQRGVSDVVHWVGTLPGRIGGELGKAGNVLYGWGSGVINGLWNGAKAVWGSVVNFFKGLPGDILHALGIHSPPQWAIDAGQWIMKGLGIGMSQAHNALDKATASVKAAASTAAGGAAGVVQKLMQQMAAARGWTGAQWNALNAVEMREAGYNMRARNPGSGAYGLAQFINGPSEYATYSGNVNTASGQITGMLNYIAQRYGTPARAWQHEMSFGWYDQGGYLPPGLSLAYNGTGKPEPVGVMTGGGRAGGDTYVINVNATPLAQPADIGRAVVGAIRQYEKRSGKSWRS
jgi:hypothetical protein